MVHGAWCMVHDSWLRLQESGLGGSQGGGRPRNRDTSLLTTYWFEST